jgi:GT2 family glycosyltransferase
MPEAPLPAGAAEDLVAIVVLNYDRRELLLRCLAVLDRLRWQHRVTVVVDNASSDGSAEAARAGFPHVVVIDQPRNLGVAGGRNAGLAWVMENHRPRYVLFIDDDTLLDPDAVHAMVRAADGGEDIAVVAPKAYQRPGERRLISAGGMRFNPYLGSAWDVGSAELDTGQYDKPLDVEACPGFAFFVRADVFERIGGFDERLNPYGWEDVEFSLRARAAGYRIVYAPDAVVYHLGGRIGRGPVAAYERHKARNMLRMLRRHATTLQLLCFALLLPPRAILRVGRELASGNWRVVGAWIVGLVRSPQR